MLEERELNIGAKVFSRLRIELHIAKVAAISARPAAMYPWPFHQCDWRVWVELVDRIERLERPTEVFGVILIAVILWQPRGFITALDSLRARLSRKGAP